MNLDSYQSSQSSLHFTLGQVQLQSTQTGTTASLDDTQLSTRTCFFQIRTPRNAWSPITNRGQMQKFAAEMACDFLRKVVVPCRIHRQPTYVPSPELQELKGVRHHHSRAVLAPSEPAVICHFAAHNKARSSFYICRQASAAPRHMFATADASGTRP